MSSFNNLLEGRRVLVTGGARGLGYAFAQAIAQAGARVVIADVLAGRVQQAACELSGMGLDVTGVSLDLASPESIDTCIERTVKRLGGLDGLVNNASITNSGGKSCEELDIETWDQVMQVNVRGTWLMTRAALPALRESGRGAVINLASDTPLWGAPNLLAYVASKGAVIAMTRSLARELGNANITVNAIAPGLVLVEATAYVPEARHRMYTEQRAIQRPQLPDDVSGAVLFALSDLSRFITGQPRRYDWDALKFQADYDPKFRRAQMRYVGTGGTGVSSDMNTIPSEHFTFSTMVIPAGHEGPPHLHTDVEEVFFVLRGKLKVIIEKDGERFETILTDRDLISVPPGVYREEINVGDEDALMCVMLGAKKPVTPTYPPAHPLASIKRG
nr:SDR family oxidoreductase [Pseudomonas putida]